MQYDIHPLVVHFPIALLFLYSIIKIVPVSNFIKSVSWKEIERFLLFLGLLGAFVARATGELADKLNRPNHDLVEMHEFFAGLVVLFYGILIAGEILSIINDKLISRLNLPQWINFFKLTEKIITNNLIVKILAILGLVAVSITGMLGGVMVYGITADPLAPYVLSLLGITL